LIIIELSEKLTGKKKGAIKGPQSVQNTSRRRQPTNPKPKSRRASLKERRDEQDHERTAKNGDLDNEFVLIFLTKVNVLVFS
jgi:hypothetical protein